MFLRGLLGEFLSDTLCFGSSAMQNGKIVNHEDLYNIPQERPEDPIEEVVDITEAMWEDRDLYISGDKLDHEP